MNHFDRTQLTERRALAARNQLEEVVAGKVKLPSPMTTLPKVAITVAAVGAVSVAAAVIPNYDTVVDTTYVECRLTLDADEFGNGLSELKPVDPNSGQDSLIPIADPIAACRALWRDGLMTNPTLTATPTDAAADQGQVPQLVLCVAEDGHAVVVPSPDPAICLKLRLAQPNPTIDTTAGSN